MNLMKDMETIKQDIKEEDSKNDSKEGGDPINDFNRYTDQNIKSQII